MRSSSRIECCARQTCHIVWRRFSCSQQLLEVYGQHISQPPEDCLPSEEMRDTCIGFVRLCQGSLPVYASHSSMAKAYWSIFSLNFPASKSSGACNTCHWIQFMSALPNTVFSCREYIYNRCLLSATIAFQVSWLVSIQTQAVTVALLLMQWRALWHHELMYMQLRYLQLKINIKLSDW